VPAGCVEVNLVLSFLWYGMMRLLLANPGYAQTFWSLNNVLKMLGKKVLAPPLGLLTLAAHLPKEWDLRLVELTARPLTEDDWAWCDAIFVTGMGVQFSGIIETIREGRRRGKTVVVGGPWVFHWPHEALSAGADIVVKGEGELAVTPLLKALADGDSGIVIEATERPDLAQSLVPRYDLLDMDLYVEMDVQFSRGCPFQCEFCDITLMYGRKVRTKTPRQILAELQTLHDLGWRRFVFIVDDNFIGNPLRAKELLRELVPWMHQRGHPFDFATQASVNLAADAEMLDLMAQAGLYRVFLGIESPDEESLRSTKKYQNVNADLDQVCEKITRAGMQIIAGCIVGFDNERSGVDQRLLDFAERNHIPEMFVTMLQVGPGTQLYLRLEREGRLLSRAFDDNLGSQTGLINFVPSRPVEQIVEEFLHLQEVLYEPGYFLERIFKHFSMMKPQPFKKGFQLPYWRELWAALIIFFRQGVLYPSRWKFWKCVLVGLVRFPRRLPHFVTGCIMAEHYFNYVRTIREKLQEQMEQIGTK
jgi:radical SAM superfamily enzyme YgiQ (UPF0313 family)